MGIQVVSDQELLGKQAAQLFIKLAVQAIHSKGSFSVALSGGSTPSLMFQSLIRPELASQVNWRAVDIFWGDERCVPPDHRDSNYGMAKEKLLSRLPIPEAQIHRIPAELGPRQAADAYEQLLRAFFQGGSTREPDRVTSTFDLVFLGMGADGHTASLFPYNAALREQHRWVEATYVEKLVSWRITLTPLAINLARQVVFLVSGGEKAARLAEVLEGPSDPHRLPSQMIRPVQGELLWLVDRPAAEALRAKGGS